MGASAIGMTELVVILVITVLLFGTKRLGSLGSDVGAAIRGLRSSFSDPASEAGNGGIP